MTKGLAWITEGERDSGKVIIASDSGEQKIIPASQYAIANINPPIYELPHHDAKDVRGE